MTDQFASLILSSPFQNSLFVVGGVILLGFILSRLKINSFRIGVTGVLIVGVIAGLVLDKYNVEMDYGALKFAKEFGLSVFIYLIGLSVGPFFFRGFRKGKSFQYNLLALVVVLLGVLIAWVIHKTTGESLPAIAGVYSGSVGTTPGMSAAQDALRSNGGVCDIQTVNQAFAFTYLIGTFLPILTIWLLRIITRVNLEKEPTTNRQKTEKALVVYKANTDSVNYRNLLLVFGGLTVGIVVGCLKLNIGKFSFGIGSTMGVLIIGILVGFAGPRMKWLDISLTNNSLTIMLRELGVALFLAVIGLEASKGFLIGINWIWLLYGALISFVPLVVVGLFARKRLKMNFYTLAGLLCGASTDTPALVYAERMNNDTPNSLPSAAYAAVYPFTLVLRIITAQLFVVI